MPHEHGDFYAIIIGRNGKHEPVEKLPVTEAEAILVAKTFLALPGVYHAEVIPVKCGDHVWDSDEDGVGEDADG